MEKEFVPYELAVKLKALGFNESCFGVFLTQEKNKLILQYFEKSSLTFATHLLPAPTFAQAFRWFRNVHNLHGCIDLHTTTPTHWYIRIDDIKTNDYLFHSLNADLRYDTYESAEQACLNKLIEIIKTK